MREVIREATRKARNRFSQSPHSWTQHVIACDSDGDEVSAFDGEAVKWCAYGCVMSFLEPEYSTHGYLHKEASSILREHLLESGMGDTIVSVWNDEPGRTVEDVLALYDHVLAGEKWQCMRS